MRPAAQLQPLAGLGVDAGRLDGNQRQVLDAIDREHKTTYALMMASQIGKTAITLPVGIRATVDGRGGLMASATDHGVKDLRRRLDRLIESSPGIGEHFPAVRSGPGARSSSACRETTAAGWLAMATAGSASQLSSRTAQVAGADEISRWPRTVRSGEGAPLQLLEARQQDWGDDAVLVAISSPVSKGDGSNSSTGTATGAGWSIPARRAATAPTSRGSRSPAASRARRR